MYSTYASYKAKKQASGTFKRVQARKQAASSSSHGRFYGAVRPMVFCLSLRGSLALPKSRARDRNLRVLILITGVGTGPCRNLEACKMKGQNAKAKTPHQNPILSGGFWLAARDLKGQVRA